jgi:sigma-B regulation protein RsbU (phosphoserine phosphatase)
VLTDVNFTRDTTSGREGLEFVERIRKRPKAPSVVVMTAWGDVDLAVQAMRRGASDFVQNPWDNARLLRTVERCAAESRAAREELGMARRVQQKPPPDRMLDFAGVHAEARFELAQEVGGDYYDFFPRGGEEFAFVLAVVCGKGIPAALLMANLQAVFRAQEPELLRRPAELLARVNERFHRATEMSRFATYLRRVRERQAGVVERRASGGGDPPLGRGGGFVRADGRGFRPIPVVGRAGGSRGVGAGRHGVCLFRLRDGAGCERRRPDGD